MNPKISIVMTYFERPEQLRKTLDSFDFHKYGSEVEVIIVDDGSIMFPAKDVVTNNNYIVNFIYLEPEKKWYKNPCIPFNIGFKHAKGEIVIIQNAECMHFDNIVNHALQNVNEDKYCVYGCYSVSENYYNSSIKNTSVDGIVNNMKFENKTATNTSDGWFNHTVYNPSFYHFCSALTLTDLINLKGFDKHYAKGIAFDDDEFLYRIKKYFTNFKIEDNFRVIHQWHPSAQTNIINTSKYWRRNKYLFQHMTKKKLPFLLTITLFKVIEILKFLKKRILKNNQER